MSDAKVAYRSTLHLPKTAFPMKADLPAQEPQRLKAWAALKLHPLRT